MRSFEEKDILGSSSNLTFSISTYFFKKIGSSKKNFEIKNRWPSSHRK